MAARPMVANSSTQPVELLVRGRWIRWEPRGRDGDVQALSPDEAQAISAMPAARPLVRRDR